MANPAIHRFALADCFAIARPTWMSLMKAGCRPWVCFLAPLFFLAAGCRSADPFGTLAQARGIEYHALLGDAASTEKTAQHANRNAKDSRPAATAVTQASPIAQSQAPTDDWTPVGHWQPTPLDSAIQLGRPMPLEPAAPPTP
jgi:hypothetical protein